MQSLLDSFQSSMQDPQRLHAMLVHLPIAAAAFGLILIIMLLCTGGKSHGMRWAAFVVLVLGAAVGFYAQESGEDAEEHMMELRKETMGPIRFALSEEATTHLKQHEKYGEWVTGALGICAIIVALTAIPSKGVRGATLVIGLLATLATNGLVAYVGHHGGALVYKHGVGVPATADNIPIVEKAEEPVDDAPQKDEPKEGDEPGEEDKANEGDDAEPEDSKTESPLGQPEASSGDSIFE